MKFQYECMQCHINQGVKVAELIGANEQMKEQMIRRILEALATADYEVTNPEMMTVTWEALTNTIHEIDPRADMNPYGTIKSIINDKMLSVYDELLKIVKQSDNPFLTGVKMAIEANIIDYGANPDFNHDQLLKPFLGIESGVALGINQSQKLYDKLRQAKGLVYIGDNCGEIVVDKVFIQLIGELFPDLDITYIVRGGSVLNDVTLQDADQVGMSQVARVIPAAGREPGFVLSKSGEACTELFQMADVVIAKGQGNFEGLSHVDKDDVFFLFVAKCNLVARIADVKPSSRVCLAKEG
jgi:uncharacterized protein with ATP-grasp and redox domains